MFFRKHGFPEDSELVICTVTRIQYNSVFVKLDEYDMQGMIHISEISPGRIRNIHDYVKEGKVVVCVVLRVNRERGHIDLSLRRVNEGQRRKKLEQMKLEQKAEKIVEFVAKSIGEDVKPLYSKIMNAIADEYEILSEFFEDYIAGKAKLEKTGLPKKTLDLLKETVKQRVKPPIVEIKGIFTINLYESNGVEKIKETLKKVGSASKENIKITYLGAGKYDLKITAPDYKEAEAIVKKAVETVEGSFKKLTGSVNFKRLD
ncbi:translation initiation factor IF-2 subunit alpha [Candidatus Woesearchaeota archaeon]|nr:translation initiation factor IF-2 subunit alpha [Candidatus Woesearchaeota archaeon]